MAELALKLKFQILCGDEIAMGPGKADLLDRIDATGSISGAARAMDMSYRRAWQLVDVMNRCWAEPLVETHPGRARGGAGVTAFGHAVLAQYRALEKTLLARAADDTGATLRDLLRPAPLIHQADRAIEDA